MAASPCKDALRKQGFDEAGMRRANEDELIWLR